MKGMYFYALAHRPRQLSWYSVYAINWMIQEQLYEIKMNKTHIKSMGKVKVQLQAEWVLYLPIQLVLGVLSPGMKLPGHSSPTHAKVKKHTHHAQPLQPGHF